MGRKENDQGTDTGFVRSVRQRAVKGVRSWEDDLKRLAAARQIAKNQDSGKDDDLYHLSSLLDSVATGIISLDGEGRIRVFNAAGEKLFGIPRVMVIGHRMNEIGRMMGFDDHGRKALWDRLSDAVWAAGAALDLEFDLVAKSGHRQVISYRVHPLGRMAWSIGNGVVIMLEDITRKKEMEDQISDARKRLLAVFDGITDGIQVVDSEFRVTAVNRSMTPLIGRIMKPGERCSEACPFSVTARADCPAEETFQTGQPVSVSRKLTTVIERGTEERVVEISTFPLLDRGNRVVQVVEYIKDVTERMRLAERLDQSRRLAELGEMAARVAHEVRNPLNAITGAAHFLATEYTEDETLQKFTNLIKRQSTRVNQVASDLLYVSKPLQTRLKSVNLHAVIDQALDSLCEQVREYGIQVALERTPDLPAIEADELQIEQALHNILQNAVEAMSAGGTLRIFSKVVTGSGTVEIGIHDSGQGIPRQNRERIFQSFFTTKTKGTGLGLTIVQRVVKNHGGEVLMEHPESGGTIVNLRFPVRNKQRA